MTRQEMVIEVLKGLNVDEFDNYDDFVAAGVMIVDMIDRQTAKPVGTVKPSFIEDDEPEEEEESSNSKSRWF